MKHTCTFLALGLVASLAFAVCSCETESAGGGGALTVSPASATISVGQSITLKASGGDVYTWDIVNSTSNNIGMLSANSGPSVVYTAIAGPGEEVIVRVTSSVGSSSSSSYSSYSSASVSTNSTTSSSPSSGTSRDIRIRHAGVKTSSTSTSTSTSFKPSSSGSQSTTSDTPPPSPGAALFRWIPREDMEEAA